MRAHMTNGTWEFLLKIAEEKKEYQFTLAYSETSENTLAYYETHSIKRSVFSAGRSYEIILKSGELEEEGFIAMNNIPLTSDGAPVFESRFLNKQNHLVSIEGFIAHRILKPLSGNTYVILTQWETKGHYDAWIDTKNYFDFFDIESIQKSAYFSARPFRTFYSFFYEEDDDDCCDCDEEESIDE